MTSNFERLTKIINQAYAENFSFLYHVERRNLPRPSYLWPRWSSPFDPSNILIFYGLFHRCFWYSVIWMRYIFFRERREERRSKYIHHQYERLGFFANISQLHLQLHLHARSSLVFQWGGMRPKQLFGCSHNICVSAELDSNVCD